MSLKVENFISEQNRPLRSDVCRGQHLGCRRMPRVRPESPVTEAPPSVPEIHRQVPSGGRT